MAISKELLETIEQINIMGEIAMKEGHVRGAEMKQRANSDLERVARTAWLNIYEHLSDKGINPDEHFAKKEQLENESETPEKTSQPESQ